MRLKPEDGRYGRWAGEPQGRAEKQTRCVAEVSVGGRSPLFKQCERKRGHGPGAEYCKQHAALLKRYEALK